MAFVECLTNRPMKVRVQSKQFMWVFTAQWEMDQGPGKNKSSWVDAWLWRYSRKNMTNWCVSCGNWFFSFGKNWNKQVVFQFVLFIINICYAMKLHSYFLCFLCQMLSLLCITRYDFLGRQRSQFYFYLFILSFNLGHFRFSHC